MLDQHFGTEQRIQFYIRDRVHMGGGGGNIEILLKGKGDKTLATTYIQGQNCVNGDCVNKEDTNGLSLRSRDNSGFCPQ